jgi:hypothetical protein
MATKSVLPPVIATMADKMLPFTWQQFFTPQRAPDMWFGDELPPTLQEQVMNPAVQQAQWIAQFQAQQTLQRAAHEAAQRAEVQRQTVARSRIGKRAKAHRN